MAPSLSDILFSAMVGVNALLVRSARALLSPEGLAALADEAAAELETATR